jgi:hypothetical protein
MPTAMRMLYPETEPVQNFQAKVWIGGDSENDAEFTTGTVKAVVAYLRSIDSRMNSDGTSQTATYQLQQWRCIDPNHTPLDYNDKWELRPLDLDTALDKQHLRKPRPENASNEFTFYIDTNKFKPGTYKYKVISFEKLEEKLHLMSKKDKLPDHPLYEHINDEMTAQDIWDNIGYVGGYNDSPIVVEDTFTAPDGEKSITISPMSYTDPDPKDPGNPDTIVMTDFVICIKPQAEW